MYIPSAFATTDADDIVRFLDRHPLATVIGLIDGRLEAHPLPFIREGVMAPGERLISHAARGNGIWRLGESQSEVLLVFSGAEAYISPSYYPTKREHPETVPTFNYARVQLRGTLTCSHDAQEKRRVVETLTNRMESGRAQPWAITDAPPDYIEKMLKGIVALSFEIRAIEAAWKASQNRQPADRRGVVEGLRADARDAAGLEAAELAERAVDRG
jgi:transcriptional regulator